MAHIYKTFEFTVIYRSRFQICVQILHICCRVLETLSVHEHACVFTKTQCLLCVHEHTVSHSIRNFIKFVCLFILWVTNIFILSNDITLYPPIKYIYGFQLIITIGKTEIRDLLAINHKNSKEEVIRLT